MKWFSEGGGRGEAIENANSKRGREGDDNGMNRKCSKANINF